MSFTDARSRKTPIPTPDIVRFGSSFLIAAGAAVLTTGLPRGIQVIAMVICVAAGILLIFSHPYRREIKAFLDERNLYYRPKFGQIVPMFLVWLALMLAPVLAPAAIWVTVLVFLGIFGWMLLVFPHVDGTRALAFVD
jgi:cytochrome bd-type quinol oxidase subunit 2